MQKLIRVKNPDKSCDFLISEKTKRVVCYKCRKGYGSEYDGICIFCRHGKTAFEAKLKGE